MGRAPLIGYRRTTLNLPEKQITEIKRSLAAAGCKTLTDFYERAAERWLAELRKK